MSPSTVDFLSDKQMRYTKKVSVWPVAFVGGLRYESPKLSPAGKVVGWKTVFDPNRPFAIDMAGFAINLRLILEKPQATFKLDGVKGGYQESSLLKDLVTMDGLEPKAANCTKVGIIRILHCNPVLKLDIKCHRILKSCWKKGVNIPTSSLLYRVCGVNIFLVLGSQKKPTHKLIQFWSPHDLSK